MIKSISPISLKNFFTNLVKRAFYDLGMNKDPGVTSYVIDVLVDFAHTERLYKIRDAQGKRLETIVDMLLETEGEFSENYLLEREIRKHIGDFALFMTGIFRDYLRKAAFLNYYIHEGTRSYLLVFESDLKAGRRNSFIFKELSSEFEFYSGALDYMKKVYFYSGSPEDPFTDFITQIKEGVKH